MANRRLLVVDDNREVGNLICHIARGVGMDAVATTTGREFKQAFEACPPDMVVLDLVMPETDGMELIRWLASQDWRERVLIVSGSELIYRDTAKLLLLSSGFKHAQTLGKPLDTEELKSAFMYEG